jgi:hypothetical protein
MWRLSSQKREIAITVGIADQGQAQQRQPRHFPRLAVLTLPQASPALGAFYRGTRVATAGLLGLCRPARPPLTLRLRRKVCTPPN